MRRHLRHRHWLRREIDWMHRPSLNRHWFLTKRGNRRARKVTRASHQSAGLAHNPGLPGREHEKVGREPSPLGIGDLRTRDWRWGTPDRMCKLIKQGVVRSKRQRAAG